MLNNVTWQPTLEASHPAQLQEPCPAVVYQEVEELRTAGAAAAGAGAPAGGASSSQRGPECRAKYVICKLPAELRYQQAAPDKPNPKMGISTVAWSHNSRWASSVLRHALACAAVVIRGSCGRCRHACWCQACHRCCRLCFDMWCHGPCSIVQHPRGYRQTLPGLCPELQPAALHRYLATLNDSTPGAAWVWDLLSGGLAAVLHHVGPVKSLRWAPKADMLAVTTGTGRVYLWSPAGASVVHIPLRGFAAQQLQWSPEGDALVLCDREAFCCAYVAGN